ncbi:hypothetical protein GCM10023186_04370 [Hymenobacter koreensis]|uniref:Secreted protein n=1 Tax=Hymenobacter koreensis TaxID=1084523 RepID=A0ABP8IV04_9BACT
MELLPQAQSVPSARTARVWELPVLTCAQLVAVPTWAGTATDWVPVPRVPLPLKPQAQRVPFGWMLREWVSPASKVAGSTWAVAE